jgi:FAD synthetase
MKKTSLKLSGRNEFEAVSEDRANRGRSTMSAKRRKLTKKSADAKRSRKFYIMVFGTFDMIHKGHEDMFKQARALAENPFLIVSIARDTNVKKIKGRSPENKESIRKRIVSANKLVDKVVLGGKEDHMPHILKEKPDVIALGYDQYAYVRGLKTQLKAAGLKTKVIRLKPFKPEKYKTSLLKKH